MKPKDLARVVADTTVQPNGGDVPDRCEAVKPSARTLGMACHACRCELRQSYAPGRQAGDDMPISSSAPTEACAGKTYLGRVIRDIGRRIDGDPELEEIFAQPLSLSRRVLVQDHRQRGPKVYSLHAPEVECIGKSKAHRPSLRLPFKAWTWAFPSIGLNGLLAELLSAITASPFASPL
jgi:transposase, IS5 family